MILMLILNEILVWYSFRRFITDAAGAQKMPLVAKKIIWVANFSISGF